MTTKILIVESNPIIAFGLQKLLESESDIRVRISQDVSMQVLDVIGEFSPNIIISDIVTDNENSMGIDFIKQVKALYAEIRFLVFSFADENIYAERVLRAKASGFVSKRENCEKIRWAIRCVINGRLFISESIEKKLVQNMYGEKITESPVDTLSDRELQILELISRGLKPSQVAGLLNLSTKTVENYRANIRTKLNINNAFELYQYAVEWNKNMSLRQVESA